MTSAVTLSGVLCCWIVCGEGNLNLGYEPLNRKYPLPVELMGAVLQWYW